MNLLKTIKNDEEYLRQISSEIDFEKDDYMDIINKTKEACINNMIYALAPVQIGIPKRLIYIRNSSSDMNKNFENEYDEGICYINPVILNRYGYTTFLEACQSCSYIKDGVRIYYTAVIDRPYKIDIQYQDLNGNIINRTLEGFEATVFCHEYDHLNGILHMDRNNEFVERSAEENKKYRSEHPYTIISETDEYVDKFIENNNNNYTYNP